MDNSPVQIVEVTSAKGLRRFVDYPNHLYKNNPYYIPAFYDDDLSDWDQEKNPAFSYCEAKAFLAKRNGKVVGRIGAILSHRANEKWGTRRMRFTQVDFIDDEAVSGALFQAVEAWAKEKGMDEVHGPLGFCDMDREGMLVEGFDRRSMFITYYNHPYYNRHLEKLGYKKDVDWIEFKIPVPEAGDPHYQKIHRVTEAILKRSDYHKVKIRRRSQLKPYIKKAFDLVNEAYGGLYGTVDLDEKQIEKYASKFIPIINLDYCCLLVDSKDNLVAFGVCAPSMADAMKKSRGRLFPFGWMRVLRSLNRNTALDMLLIAVRPDLQGKGLNAVLMDHVMQSAIRNGIRYAETGPCLEKNDKIIGQWKMFDLQPHKRRRCYIKQLSGTEEGLK